MKSTLKSNRYHAFKHPSNGALVIAKLIEGNLI